MFGRPCESETEAEGKYSYKLFIDSRRIVESYEVNAPKNHCPSL
jgi:hypothetical protein